MDHTRHSALFSIKDVSVTLIGCGGIGASTALVLAKMGLGYLNLLDGDTVDDVNLATQFHRLSDVGRSKVDAVTDMIKAFSDDTDVLSAPYRVERDAILCGEFIISAVDSITARKDIWYAVKKSSSHYYIDARMAAEEAVIHFIDLKSDYRWYENILDSQTEDNVAQDVCTAKATIYCSAIIAGMIGSAIKTVSIGEHQAKMTIFNIRRNTLTVIP
jgi:molybdopterin/thiamine biosynthesis adenylyltransferase